MFTRFFLFGCLAMVTRMSAIYTLGLPPVVKDLLASREGSRIHLEQFPSYAPELNPDEGVWNYLKRVELKNVNCQVCLW